MIFRFLRILLSSGAVYAFFRVGYPEAGHQLYHTVTPLGLLAAAAVLAFVFKLVEFASTTASLLCELAFAAAVLLAVGFTMPSKDQPPIVQLMGGRLPTQAAVREGLGLIGLDPKSDAGAKIVRLFPK